MIDFNIEFIDNNEFLFEDISDLTVIPVKKTTLSIYLDIEDENPETVSLYDIDDSSLPIKELGNNVEINLDELGYIFSLEDNVYKISYNLILEDDSTLNKEKFFIKDLDLKICKREIIEDIITDSSNNNCRACEATFFESVLQSSYDAIEDNKIKEANYFIEFLKKECKTCC